MNKNLASKILDVKPPSNKKESKDTTDKSSENLAKSTISVKQQPK